MSNIEETLLEAKLCTEDIRNSLISEVDPANISHSSKVPYKILVVRESMLYRVADLAESSCYLLEKDNLVSSAVTIRSFQETVAAIFFVNRKMKKAIEDKDICHLDDAIMRTLLGAKNNDDMPDPINVLTMIDKVSKEIPVFRKVYDDLSEISHLNWAGTTKLYSYPDPVKMITYLGRNIEMSDEVKMQCASALRAGLKVVIYAYDEYVKLLPKLIKICEEDIAMNASNKVDQRG